MKGLNLAMPMVEPAIHEVIRMTRPISPSVVTHTGIRSTVVITIILLLSISLSVFRSDMDPLGSAAGSLTQVQPIVIEGNSGFASHPLVTGGGTISNPYVISNHLIDCSSSTRAAIAIRNTTAFFLVKNITIQASSTSPGILTRGLYQSGSYQAMNGRFENVTLIGGGTQVYLERPIRMVFKECNFSNPSGTGYAIRLYGGYDNTFDQNRFNFPNQDIFAEYYSYFFFFKRNTGSFRDLVHDYFRYSDISNNTLTSRTWNLYSGYLSDFQGNKITSSSSSNDILNFVDSHRIKIANNTLQGGRYALQITHPNTYSPVATYYYHGGSYSIEFNRINRSSMNGIHMPWYTGHPAMAYLSVHHNRFTNCSGYAIYQQYGSLTNRVFRNLFEFNTGTGTSYSIGNSQAFDAYHLNSWANIGVGNYWRDKTGPDENSDGFVDDLSYPINGWTGSGKDPAPVTNPYFDLERPMITLIKPTVRTLDAGYVNISWTSHDNLSGVEKVLIRLDEGIWNEKGPEGSYGLKLTTGAHRLYLKVVDRAKLWTIKEVSFFVTSDRSPVKMSSPSDGGYYDHGELTVTWSVTEGFVPIYLTFKLDLAPAQQKDPTAPFSIIVEEGFHDLTLTFMDAYGNLFEEKARFATDWTPPELSLLYPSDGIIISNPVVYFKWETSDLTGMNRTDVCLDDGVWNTTDKDLYSLRVNEGPHTFKVRVTDMAGNSIEKSSDFQVRVNTSLHIKGPILDRPTSVPTHRIEWEYLASFEIASLSLAIDNNLPLVLSHSTTYHDITLNKDGLHYITVRALDPVNNEIKDRISILLDRTPPEVGFLSHQDGSFVNSDVIDLEWNALESYGLDGYSLYLDGNLVASGIKERTRTVRLGVGVHDIGLEAVDMAGNIGRANLTLIVDLEPPDVEMVLPERNIVKDRYYTIRWSATDDWGLAGFLFSIDDEEQVDMGDSLFKDLVFENEGLHRVRLTCLDLAGNNRTIFADLMVDLNAPEASFISVLDGRINRWGGMVEWSASDTVGLKSVVLSIDGTEIPLSPNATFYMLEISDGPHTFILNVTDLADRTVSRTVTFVLDRSAPKVVKALETAIVKGNRARITWVLEEGHEGLTAFVRVDNQTHPKAPVLSDGEMEVGPLSPGTHKIDLVITDLAGNVATLSWTVTVNDMDNNRVDRTMGLLPFIIAAAVILLVLAAIATLVILNRRRRPEKAGERAITAPRRPDRIKVGGVPMRPAPSCEPVKGPEKKGHVLDEGLGPSYYRPEKATKKKGMKKGTEQDMPQAEGTGTEHVPSMADQSPGQVPEVSFFSTSPPPPTYDEPERVETRPPPASEVDDLEDWGGEGEELEELEELEEVEEWGD